MKYFFLFLLTFTLQVFTGQWVQEYKRALQTKNYIKMDEVLKQRTYYADWRSDMPKVVLLAAQYNHAAVIELCRQENISVDSLSADGATPLMVACYCGNVDFVKKIIKIGAAINYSDTTGWTPLLCAVDQEHAEIVGLLLQEGASTELFNELGLSPLLCAADKGAIKIVQLLLQHGADINQCNDDGWTALHCAVDANNKEMVMLLLTNGAEINRKNKLGKTVVHAAVYKNSISMLNLLLTNSADPNAQDVDGITPLMVAIFENYTEIVDLLLPLSCLNNQSLWGWTALHFAVHCGNAAYMQKLIAAGATIDSTDHVGCTPLIIAAVNKKNMLMNMLIDAGADSDHKDIFYKTADDWYIS